MRLPERALARVGFRMQEMIASQIFLPLVLVLAQTETVQDVQVALARQHARDEKVKGAVDGTAVSGDEAGVVERR